MQETSRLHAYLCNRVSPYVYEHQEAYQTVLLFGTSEEDVERQTHLWRQGKEGNLAWSWRDEQIDDTTLMRVIAFEAREDFEARELSHGSTEARKP